MFTAKLQQNFKPYMVTRNVIWYPIFPIQNCEKCKNLAYKICNMSGTNFAGCGKKMCPEHMHRDISYTQNTSSNATPNLVGYCCNDCEERYRKSKEHDYTMLSYKTAMWAGFIISLTILFIAFGFKIFHEKK